MEYRVYLPKLRQSAERLEQIARQQRRTYDSLEETIRKLRRLSYMEPVLTVLARRMRELEEELQKILRMAQSLRRIEQTYREMEERILDGLELPAGQRQNIADMFKPHMPSWPPTFIFPPSPKPWIDLARIKDIFKVVGGNRGATDTNTIPPQDPTASEREQLIEKLRDISLSPLWVTLEGRNSSQWCCPVVEIPVSPMNAPEIPDGLLIRLSETAAADN